MPCQTYTPQEQVEQANEEIKRLSRLLCEACRSLDYYGKKDISVHPVWSKELKAWWKEHRRADEARSRNEERERIRHRALRKLTDAEKRVLGLLK